MFEIVNEARLKPRHIAKFVQVGRVTASRWLNEHVEPHPQLMSKVERFLSLVRKGVEDGKLPIPSGVSRQDENGYLTNLFRGYLKAEKHDG